MSNDILTADMGFVWVQPDGPNTEMKALGCHDVGDIAQPQGDIALRYCPDVAGPGRWKTASRTQGPPGEVTTSITTYVRKVADWMQKYRSCGAIYVHQSICGRKDVFANYDAGSLLYDAVLTNKSKSNTAMRETSDASEQTFDVSAAPPLSEYWKLAHTSLTTTEAGGLNDIAICGETMCAGPCGPVQDQCDKMCAVADNIGAATPDMICTTDAGTTWAIGATDPFAVSEAIAFVVCFPVDRGVIRRLVGCGTTAAGLPPRVAYSDDSGATWSADINVGAVNADYFLSGGSGFAIDQNNIWVVDDGGDIFKSEDGGLTWTEQVTANATALNYVHFADERTGLTVGDTNVIYSTVDGGEHWTLVTGPAAQAAADCLCCSVLDRYRWFIGYDDGELWYTNDGGDNWSQRVLPAPAEAVSVDAIQDMEFLNHYHGVMAMDWTGAAAANRASYYRTVNGGTDWEIYDVPDDFDGADTLNSVIMCDENTVYGVGGLISAVAYIGTLQPS